MTELDALNNAANSTNIEGILVNNRIYEDRRKSTKHYFLTLNGQCISPSLNYDNMNHFILGFKRGLKLSKQTL